MTLIGTDHLGFDQPVFLRSQADKPGNPTDGKNRARGDVSERAL